MFSVNPYGQFIYCSAPICIIVVGFNEAQYNFPERSQPYEVTIQVLTPPASLQRPVSVQIHVIPGSATS